MVFTVIFLTLKYVMKDFNNENNIKQFYQVENSVSPNGNYIIEIQGNGPRWPFGSEDLEIIAYKKTSVKNSNKKTFKTQLCNDGKGIRESNYDIDWSNNGALITISGEEQKNEYIFVDFKNNIKFKHKGLDYKVKSLNEFNIIKSFSYNDNFSNRNVELYNINIDLIYGVNDNIDIVKKDVDYFLSLDIPHISCYSLIIEDNTLLKINNYQNIDEDIEYEMYKYIENKLTSNGYIHYEISNYAKEGYQSTHNINYWDNGSYYGFGLGSVSYIDNYRISNTKNISKYNKGIYISNREYEDMNTNMSNDMILGLRKIKGVSISKFYNKYKKDIREVFDIDDLINNKILIIDNDNMYIDSKYIYLSNQVLIRFIK